MKEEAAATPDHPGQRDALAAGADGIAYRHLDPERGGLVELRRLARARADAARWPALAARIEAAASLSAPGALRVYERDLEAEVPWFVIESGGRTLLDAIAGGPLPVEEALGYLLRPAQALAEAHRIGLVHGCLCPGHIILRTDGSAAIDLTGASAGGDAELGGFDRACRAPEPTPTAAADVYGLAALLSCLTSGQPASAPPAPVEASGKSWLGRLTEAMLDPDPDERPPLPHVLSRLELAGATDTGELRRSGALPTVTALDDTVADAADGAPGTGGGQIEARAQRSPEAGELLGRYRLLSVLGEGGMGRVFRGEDTVTGETVAVKVVHGWATDDVSRRRFSREARLLSRVESDHVARLLGADLAGDLRYLVMEFLEGPSLRDVLNERRTLDEELALTVAADMARALADVHSAGIVHRDVKPANIILSGLDGDGPVRARLCDLGIARKIDPSTTDSITRTGAFVGTPQYMAPEQCMGQDVDERSDVYALGATLYAMLTGRPPFTHTDLGAIISAHLDEEPPDLRRLHRDLGEEVVRIVGRALEKVPERRYGDARELLEELERLRRGEPTEVEAHPRLPEADGAEVRTYVLELDLDADPEALWPLVANTNRVNRAIGLGSVEVTRHSRAGRLETTGHTRTLGLDLEWREHAFEWVVPRRFGVLREFARGPVRWYRNTVELEPRAGGGTHLRHTIEAAPRGLLGRAAATFEIGLRTRRALARVYRRIDRIAQRGPAIEQPTVEDPFEPPRRLRGPRLERLEEIEARLLEQGCDREVVERLGELLRQAPDQELSRLRPREIARRFGLDAREVLAAMLRAAREGALVLRWDILCPSCRAPSEMASALDQVEDHGRCEACDLEFEADFGRSIELVFQSHPAIRESDAATYCIGGGPSHLPHVALQVRLEPGERFLSDLRLPRGGYRVLGRELPRAWSFRVDPAAALSRLEISLHAGIAPDRPRAVAPDRQKLILTNDLEEAATVRVERDAREEEAFTAADAACSPEFRSLFADELLSPGVLVGVSHIVILLAELEGGAAEASGDEWPLYRALAELRETVEQAASREGGTVVKIHGRGVLAVFPDPVAAVRAVLGVGGGDRAAARMAVHGGPAMVTTINHRLDYFGELVLEASELVAAARAGEAILGESVVADPGVAELLREEEVPLAVAADPANPWVRIDARAAHPEDRDP